MAFPAVTPANAWQPLPASQWDEAAARHLLRRAGWAAQPSEVARALRDGLPATLNRLFPAESPAFAEPESVTRAAERVEELRPRIRESTTPEERRKLQQEERDIQRQAVADLSLAWLRRAAAPGTAAFEKWLLFLSDVYVISVEKVRDPRFIHRHNAILRSGAAGPAPDLVKAVSRSPAMILYLDLQRSQPKAPNENFARELFELFTLGEGNYTEADIKEAARAFTGYRQNAGEFRFALRQHDAGPKTVFGQIGEFDGDAVIDLAYRQPAAARFLPREMVRFYLSDTPLTDAYLDPLAAWWSAQGFNLRALCHRFFGSTIFYHPARRAGLIKSPVQFYLGLLQDLDLDVTPLNRATLQPLRQMGQQVFNPPNVRGWVGGRAWINSATLSARRQLVNALFAPVDEARMNADERRALEAARAAGATRFTVDDERLAAFAALGPDAIVARFTDYFLPSPVTDAYRAALRDFLAEGGEALTPARVRQAAVAVLQSPDYQLC